MKDLNILVPTTTFPKFPGDYWANFLEEIFKQPGNGNVRIKVLCPHFKGAKASELFTGPIEVKRFRYFWPESLEKVSYGDGVAVNIRKNPFILLLFPFFGLFFLLNILKEHKECDLIHAQLGPSGLISIIAMALTKTKKPIITSFYGRDVSGNILIRWLYKPLFKYGSLFLVLGEEMKQTLKAWGCDESKIKIFPIWVDTKRFENKNKHGGRTKLIFVGRFIEKKGLVWGIRAFNECHKKDNRLRFMLVGDGPEKEKIQKKVKLLGIGQAVDIINNTRCNKPRDITIKMLKESDIFVLPSITSSDGDKEGTPTVLIEAQAAGLPCISTNHAGIPEIVIDKKTGLISDEKDYRAMSTNILRMVRDKRMYDSMRKEAIKNAKRYDVHERHRELMGIYRQIYCQNPKIS
ncbi:MAG TPA: colanic acid biosynthesis glycosyltransferase WcaL [Nanoarchaeota archaeon]|nr:colanic acid biosynthesis glycosyltransferase WcaL [Nanoarchaeota archaeon]